MTRMVLLACVLGLSDVIVAQSPRDEAVRMATEALSTLLEAAPDTIRLVSVEEVEWSDSSLGCPERGMAYLPAIVPGFRVRLAVGDRYHQVHTGGGRAIVCRSGAPSSNSRSPMTPARAAADRARRHLATTLGLTADDVRVMRVRQWRSGERPCDAPDGTTIEGETFAVDLQRGRTTYRYRATSDVAWACK
jgi:hypothetical protein